MKKIALCLMALVMVFSFAACGEDSGDNGGDNTGGDKKYTATVTAPEGWTLNTEDKYSLIRYDNGDADSFWVRKPTAGSDTAVAATSYKNAESRGSAEFTWDAIKDVAVNTYAAKNLTYVAELYGVRLKYAAYFVTHGNNIFIIVCQTQESKYDGLKDDYDSFLASFAVKEA